MASAEAQEKMGEAAQTQIDPETLGARERAAYDIVAEMCDKMGMDIRPVVRSLHDPYVEIDLVGEDAAPAFGRYGKRLDALQYLANLVIGRKVGADVRVVLDAADYRARRTQQLIELAKEYAAQVKERQEEAELDPLPAHERRIIHNALAEETGIRTYSEGDDPDRRVIIAPK